MNRDWDETFDSVLRKHLRQMPADEPLLPAAKLLELGLDSLGMVSMLMHLESAYGIAIPDSEITLDTFSTPETLWAAVVRQQATIN